MEAIFYRNWSHIVNHTIIEINYIMTSDWLDKVPKIRNVEVQKLIGKGNADNAVK